MLAQTHTPGSFTLRSAPQTPSWGERASPTSSPCLECSQLGLPLAVTPNSPPYKQAHPPIVQLRHLQESSFLRGIQSPCFSSQLGSLGPGKGKLYSINI